MADLTGSSVGARDDLTAEDDSATDTCSEGDHDDIVMSLAAAVPLLAQSRDVGVISYFYGNAAQKRSEFLADVHFAPA